MTNTIIFHAIAVPIIIVFISLLYFKKFGYTSPFLTAILFFLFAIIIDAGLIAPVFEKSYEMFTSVLGTWIPFALIFLSTSDDYM